MKLKYTGPKNPCKVFLGNQSLECKPGETVEVGGHLANRLAKVEGNGFEVVSKEDKDETPITAEQAEAKKQAAIEKRKATIAAKKQAEKDKE